MLLCRQINICSKKMVEEEEEEEEESLSIYLNLIAGDLANLAEGWSRFAKLKLSLIDQANDEMTIVGGFMLLSLLFPPLIFNLASSIFFFSFHIVLCLCFTFPNFLFNMSYVSSMFGRSPWLLSLV